MSQFPINKTVWCKTDHKVETRQATVIDVYREVYGRQVPKGRQFWSMCGRCTDDNHQPHPGTEVGQLIEQGVITEDQFHGVEINPETVKDNRQAYPAATFYEGDIYQELCKAPVFDPAVVNIDHVSSPEITGRILADTMDMLTEVPGEVMVVLNSLTGYMNIPERKFEPEDIVGILNQTPSFKSAWRSEKWRMHDTVFKYITKTGSEMTTVIFFKS